MARLLGNPGILGQGRYMAIHPGIILGWPGYLGIRDTWTREVYGYPSWDYLGMARLLGNPGILGQGGRHTAVHPGIVVLCIYGRRKKKVPISRPYNGTGISVPFPFNFRAVAVLVRFQTVPVLSHGQLVHSGGVIKHAQSLIAVISAERLATVQ